MALNLPESATEVVRRVKVDIQRELNTSNPFLRNSWLGALITGIANRIYDFVLQLKEAFKQAVPDTATEDILERWAAIWGINRLAATAASGNVVATGTATTSIPSGTLLATSDGKVYESTASVVITASVISVSSITRSGATATATTASNHGLASNVPVTIAGANEAEYNVTDAEITITGLNTFTYQVTGAPATPATGTITAAFTAIQVPVESQDFGADQNQDPDAVLSLQSPIAGVDDEMQVDWGELGGGSDQETDTELRARLLDRIQNPIAHFNVAEITAVAKTVNGVTRVFVQEATPATGQVTIYFMRDNDPDPIPDASEIAAVDAVIQAIRPANTAEVDVIVGAPTGVPVAFTFTALSPNTSTMKTAISANLAQFFDEQTEVGTNIPEDAYRSAIFNTIDTETGDEVSSFTLSAPSGAVAISSGEIGTLGTITYP
jgi:uncharacterized phage protein gp47/JayE